MRVLVIILLFLGLPGVALAQGSGEPNMLVAALKMVAALAAVCGLLLLLYAASRRGFGFLPQKKSELIEILETRPLGGRKFLCVVRVRNEEILLGLSHDRIEHLARLTPSTPERFSDHLQQAQKERT